MAAEAYGPHNAQAIGEGADFCLSPDELSKGAQAAATYLESMKPGEARRGAESALDTLAAVISGGVCGGARFPWHQVRAYHGALALSIVKERGAPAHIETLRCRHDETRKFQQVPEAYKPKDIQRMKSTLEGVLQECWNLGFISDEQRELALRPPKRRTPTRSSHERELTDAEVRALLAACDMDETVLGARDALMIGLAWHGGLKSVDLISLTLDDLSFDAKTGCSTIRHRSAGGKRARRIPLPNEDLIALEDWLEARGRGAGALFCPVARGHVELRRLSGNDVRSLCDQRAAEAGVLPFAPNDLARSSPFAPENAKRRRTTGAEEPPVELSPLYADVEPDPSADEAERISFPYRVRVGR